METCGILPIHLTDPNSGPDVLTQATLSPSDNVGAIGSSNIGSLSLSLSLLKTKNIQN